ncbi:MAG: tryptophan--tRNA ligase [Pseudomonadota bacterium]
MKRIVSGIRPTGKLHWGHYFGIVENWVKLQSEYECFYFIADWHALTSEFDNVEVIKPATLEIIADLLAAGLDPEKSTIFIQSQIPQHTELQLALAMLTPISWLERVPSYKDLQQQMSGKDLSNYGFLGYPLLQTADIIMYKALKVPVGEDQVAHIEFSREVVRRFHYITKKEIFVEPQPLLTKTPRIPGLDGRKMSKSFNNAIFIADDEQTIAQKMMQAITDPARKRKNDPGHPEVCNIFAYHQLYTKPERIAEIEAECRQGSIGCVDCKKECIKNAVAFWQPMQEKRQKYLAQGKELFQIAKNGAQKAMKEAEIMMERVREAMGLDYL